MFGNSGMTNGMPFDDAVDLTNCDREPIHIPGIIQPYGFLLSLAADWTVSRASANVADFLGVSADAMQGRPIGDFLSDEAIHAIRNRVSLLRGPDAVERLFKVPMVDGRSFDVAVHFSGTDVVLEAEPHDGDETDAASTVRAMIARVAQADSMHSFFRDGARQVRALTGFDRVMVYRFDPTGSGEVVAEAARPGIGSFLGLHYPASDIPAQARALYKRNIFRIIADIKSTPVPVLPRLDEKGEALDMSLSILRAVSPIHIEYLNNMGVGASLSISIIVGGELWGLFACHHYSPRLPSFAQRSAAELFGQIYSMMLESRERAQTSDYEIRARAAADRLMSAVARDEDLLSNAQWLGDIIFDTVPADGVGVYIDGAMSLSGLTPEPAQFSEIAQFLSRVADAQIFTTECIAQHLPGAAVYADKAAGMLAIPLSRRPRDYVVLFRSEQLRSVRWGGNPEKEIEYGPNGPRLTPRKSFEEWSELVKGKAEPFTGSELRVAETLRIALLEVVLRLADAAGEERQRANEKQELLIAELNHRVRNILALIRGLISQTRQSALSAESFIETLDDRVQALARGHDQITADRWGPARLIDLIETEAGAYLGERRDRVLLAGPNVLLEPTAFTVVALVIHEMLTNAAKYGALADSRGTVSIVWDIDAEGSLLLRWKERGGPPVVAPSRRGFGSTIIERSIPYDLGGRADIHYKLTGLEAEFGLPARHVARILPDIFPESAPDTPARKRQRPLDGRAVMLVEDNMIIAMDGEDALRELGGAMVHTAASVRRAMALLDEEPIGFAVLDFNLGNENSIPVAEALKDRGIPFLFASGYGDGLELPDALTGTGIVKKPYDIGSLARAIDESFKATDSAER